MDSIEDRDIIVRVLAEHDLACPSCGYNLRGLTNVNCPECNQRLVLRVGLAEPRIGSFVAGLVAIAGGLGFCTILFAYFVVYFASRYGRGGPPLTGVVPLPIGMLIGGAMLWWWVKRRGRLARMSDGRRLATVFAVWVVSLVCPVLFTVLVR
jgi:hypothetical protein